MQRCVVEELEDHFAEVRVVLCLYGAMCLMAVTGTLHERISYIKNAERSVLVYTE